MKRVPLQSIVVQRDGKSFTPPIGQPFDFTKEEVDQIERMAPEAISTEAVVDVTAVEAESKPAGKGKGATGDL